MRPVLGVPLLLLLLLGPLAGHGIAVPGPDEPGDAAGLVGRLLVAEPELVDPNFMHAVVLVVHHGSEGSLGLVVNRPYGKVPTAELLRRLGLDGSGIAGLTTLFYGGPVAPELGMVVHSADYARADTRQIAAGIAVTSDPAIIQDLAAGKGPAHAVPVLGYAGWGPGQLASELAQGAWFTIPADPALVFAPDALRIWDEALTRKGVDL